MKHLVDAADQAFIEVMRVSGGEEWQNKTVEDLQREREARVEGARVELIEVPQVKWWHRKLMKITSIPSPQDQLREMSFFAYDQNVIHWGHLGVALGDPEPELDDHLCAHPHGVLAGFMTQIAQFSFAPEAWRNFEMYFRRSDREKDGMDPVHVFQVYVTFVFLHGTESQANSIGMILSIGQTLRNMRAELRATKQLFRKQSVEVAQYLEALERYRVGGFAGQKPDWRDFVE